MNAAIQTVAALSILCEPYLPNTSKKIKQMLNLSNEDLSWTTMKEKLINGSLILENHQINQAELLFQKIEDKDIEAQIEKLKATAVNQSNPKAKPMKDEITFDEFTKMDIRISTILTAEKHPDADKLLKMTVDTGIDERTIVSGIA